MSPKFTVSRGLKDIGWADLIISLPILPPMTTRPLLRDITNNPSLTAFKTTVNDARYLISEAYVMIQLDRLQACGGFVNERRSAIETSRLDLVIGGYPINITILMVTRMPHP